MKKSSIDYNELTTLKDKTMNKADNLPMSAEEYFNTNINKYNMYVEIIEDYANYLLYHHINVLAERKYSEEDLKEAHKAGAVFAYGRKESTKTDRENNFKEWFEQFKK